MSGTATATAPGGRSLRPLWMLVAVFALPSAAAWFFHLNPEFLPAGRVNRGELIDPPRPWPTELALTTATGTAFDRAVFEERWSLIVLSRAPCSGACERHLAELRQIKRALGEGGSLVERFALLAGEGPFELAPALEGTEVLRAPVGSASRLEAFFGPGPDIWDRVYVVDPFGNLMMRYAADAPPKDVLKDMERVLKASKTWIKGANDGNR